MLALWRLYRVSGEKWGFWLPRDDTGMLYGCHGVHNGAMGILKVCVMM